MHCAWSDNRPKHFLDINLSQEKKDRDINLNAT